MSVILFDKFSFRCIFLTKSIHDFYGYQMKYQISNWSTVSQTMSSVLEPGRSVSVCQQELELWIYVQPHHYGLKGLVFLMKLSGMEDSELPKPLTFF